MHEKRGVKKWDVWNAVRKQEVNGFVKNVAQKQLRFMKIGNENKIKVNFYNMKLFSYEIILYCD
jgi:hypothetical protein